MRELPKHHDRIPEVRAKIEEYRRQYQNANHYELREELGDEIEILHLGDIPEDVEAAVRSSNNGENHLAIFLDIATIIQNHPRIPVAHIKRALKINDSIYYNITRPAVVADYLVALRRTVIDGDVIAAGLVLRRLLDDPEPRVRFQAAKFILENNGQAYGYGNTKDDTKNAVKIVIEDKRTNSIRYSDDDLADV